MTQKEDTKLESMSIPASQVVKGDIVRVHSRKRMVSTDMKVTKVLVYNHATHVTYGNCSEVIPHGLNVTVLRSL